MLACGGVALLSVLLWVVVPLWPLLCARVCGLSVCGCNGCVRECLSVGACVRVIAHVMCVYVCVV